MFLSLGSHFLVSTISLYMFLSFFLSFQHYGNQSRGYLIGGRPLWPPAVPRLAARPSQSNPRGSGPEVLKRERGHVTAETGVAEVGVFRALQPNEVPDLFSFSLSFSLKEWNNDWLTDWLTEWMNEWMPPARSLQEQNKTDFIASQNRQ